MYIDSDAMKPKRKKKKNNPRFRWEMSNLCEYAQNMAKERIVASAGISIFCLSARAFDILMWNILHSPVISRFFSI